MTILAAHGTSSLDAAYSVLGRLFAFAKNRGDESVTGLVVADWIASVRPSNRLNFGLTWLRDHCGIDLPVRTSITRPIQGYTRPTRSNSTETLTLRDIVGLEVIADEHPSQFMRSHAAAWVFMAMNHLRVEQSSEMAINAIGEYMYENETFRIASSSLLRDKHPDPQKRRPRPAWGIADGLIRPDAIVKGLREMLRGQEGLMCLLRDTNSASGAPDSSATKWLAAPLISPSRVCSSLQHLLESHPINRAPEDAARFKGHSAKRFLQNVCQTAARSGELTVHQAHEVARFSKSVAQVPELEPTAEMLRRHTLYVSVLPDIYGKNSRVQGVFDTLCCLHKIVKRAASRLGDPSQGAPGAADWGRSGPFRPSTP